MGFDLFGKSAGVIGTGRIGRTLIGILRGFGMEIIANDPFPNDELIAKFGVKYVDPTTIFKESDIITLHFPLTPESHHLINSESIDLMKPGVMIINTGRGRLIDTRALIAGLRSDKIGSAGLDVYEEESEIFFEDLLGQTLTDDVLARLLSFNNVLVTSHQAFFTREALLNIARTTLEMSKPFWAMARWTMRFAMGARTGAAGSRNTGFAFFRGRLLRVAERRSNSRVQVSNGGYVWHDIQSHVCQDSMWCLTSWARVVYINTGS